MRVLAAGDEHNADKSRSNATVGSQIVETTTKCVKNTQTEWINAGRMTKNVKLNNDTGKQARAQTLNQVFISVCRPIKNNMLHFNWAPSQPVFSDQPH